MYTHSISFYAHLSMPNLLALFYINLLSHLFCQFVNICHVSVTEDYYLQGYLSKVVNYVLFTLKVTLRISLVADISKKQRLSMCDEYEQVRSLSIL